MQTRRTLLREGFLAGARKGWSGFVWMMKILIPISLLTAVLAWSGWIEKGDFLIQPIMGWLSLPAMAALPLLIGTLTGIYGAIAAMVVLPFTKGQMTLIAIFLLIAHNLVQEGVIQGKAGILWMTAAIFGLAYSAAVIVEEAKEGQLGREELEGLHLSIGINHALVEDPALFLALGLNAFWLWVPRLITAMFAVRLLTLWQYTSKRLQPSNISNP